MSNAVAVLGCTSGGSGVAIIAAGGGGTDLYCHSEPPLTSGKLFFIINFIWGATGDRIFTGCCPLAEPLNRPGPTPFCYCVMCFHEIKGPPKRCVLFVNKLIRP